VDKVDEKDENEEELFKDVVESVLQGAEELPTVNAGVYIVAVNEFQLFPAEGSMDQSQVKRGHIKLEYLVIKGTNAFSHPLKAVPPGV
jgi:hypothetical protein